MLTNGIVSSVVHRVLRLLLRRPSLSRLSLSLTPRGVPPLAKPMRRALQNALTTTRETCRSAIGIWNNW